MNSLFLIVLQRILPLILLVPLLTSNGVPIWLPIVRTGTEATLNGKSGPITITRDEYGVPHIRAATESDAQFGLGYVHAQDRLWQMEWQRRLASGRTAEFLGTNGIEIDMLFRTVGLRRAAEAAWVNLSPADRLPIEAYVAGVNTFLGSTSNQQLPPEFGILGFTPEPWTPVDVLAFGKLFTWGNGANWEKELLRGQLTQLLGPERATQLTPAYLADGPTIIPQNQRSAITRQNERASLPEAEKSAICSLPSGLCADLLALHQRIVAQTGIADDGRGSNTWVVSGARTTTGKPLLANDPHLDAQSPGFWYLAQLSWGNNTVIGATVPGSLGVQIGHNNHIAWGVTTINVDTQDIYVEQVNERNEALFQGQWQPMRVVPETIKIKGQAERTLNVRISRHGPLISDLLAESEQSASAASPSLPTALSLHWTGHDPSDDGMLVTLAVNRARNWKGFTTAFNNQTRFYRPANLNYVYADHAGNIGYFAAATVPMRAKGNGSLPSLGWTGEYEWTGYVPWERLPQTYNPPEDYIVSANNNVAGDDYPYSIGNSYAAPYRAARIVEVLQSKGKLKFSADDMAVMQGDVFAVHARKLMPLLLRTEPADIRGQQALDLLKRWDLRATGDSAATAVFEAWYVHIAQRLFEDELGDLWESYSDQLYFVGMATELALQEHPEWCDDVRTEAAETCGDTLAAALEDGLNDMSAAQGNEDMETWRWDKVHQAQFTHQPLGGNPQAGPLFNRSIASGGDRFTVNVASSFKSWNDYQQRHAAQYRQIIDFADLAASRWVVAPGQGGDPKKPHYDDLLTRWQRIEYLPMQ